MLLVLNTTMLKHLTFWFAEILSGILIHTSKRWIYPSFIGVKQHDSTTNSWEWQMSNNDVIKILGLWSKVDTDKILFQHNFSEIQEVALVTPDTKWDILSKSSRIFNPLGIFSLVTVPAKLLMQKLWETKLGSFISVPQVSKFIYAVESCQ